MQLISENTLKQALNGFKGMGELAEKGMTTLVDEVIKLYIFFGVVGLLKASVVFIIRSYFKYDIIKFNFYK